MNEKGYCEKSQESRQQNDFVGSSYCSHWKSAEKNSASRKNY